MNLNYILNLDCRNKSNYEILENELLYLKPFSKLEEIKLENVERFLYQAQNKYMLSVESVSPDFKSSDEYMIWCSTINNGVEFSRVYSTNIYCVLMKTAYLIYYMIKNKKVKKRG